MSGIIQRRRIRRRRHPFPRVLARRLRFPLIYPLVGPLDPLLRHLPHRRSLANPPPDLANDRVSGSNVAEDAQRADVCHSTRSFGSGRRDHAAVGPRYPEHHPSCQGADDPDRPTVSPRSGADTSDRAISAAVGRGRSLRLQARSPTVMDRPDLRVGSRRTSRSRPLRPLEPVRWTRTCDLERGLHKNGKLFPSELGEDPINHAKTATSTPGRRGIRLASAREALTGVGRRPPVVDHESFAFHDTCDRWMTLPIPSGDSRIFMVEFTIYPQGLLIESPSD
jgi:hypothetical protein